LSYPRFVVAGLADLLAFVGAHKGQPCLLSFWLVIGIVNIAGYFLLWALIPTLIYASHLTDQPFFGATRVIRKMFDGNWYISGLVIAMVAHFILAPIFYLYFWIVVKSYRKTLLSSEGQVFGGPENPQGYANHPQAFSLPIQPVDNSVAPPLKPVHPSNQMLYFNPSYHQQQPYPLNHSEPYFYTNG